MKKILIGAIVTVQLYAGFWGSITQPFISAYKDVMDVLSVIGGGELFPAGADSITITDDLSSISIRAWTNNYCPESAVVYISTTAGEIDTDTNTSKDGGTIVYKASYTDLYEIADQTRPIVLPDIKIGGVQIMGGPNRPYKYSPDTWEINKSDSNMKTALQTYLSGVNGESANLYLTVILGKPYRKAAFDVIYDRSDEVMTSTYGPIKKWLAYDINKSNIDSVTPANKVYESGTPYDSNNPAKFTDKTTALVNHSFDTFTYPETSETSKITAQSVIYKNGVIEAEKVTARDNNYIVGGYVTEWSIYAKDFMLEPALAPSAYNRLTYAFAAICGDQYTPSVAKACAEQGKQEHEMVIVDLWGGFMVALSEEDKAKPWNDVYGETNLDNINTSNVRGVMGMLLNQREKDTSGNLKINLSIGGWTFSEPYTRMAASEANRTIFVNSVIAFVKKFDLDGVDIDWEFPGQGGAAGVYDQINDGKNYVALIKQVREALNTLASQTGKTYEVSSAVGVTKRYIDLIGRDNYKELNNYIDKIYLMNYDFGGAWDKTLIHQANLFGNTENSIEKGIDLLRSYGVDKSKLIVGVANYSRSNIAQITSYSPLASNEKTTTEANTGAVGTYEPGILEGYDLFANFETRDLGFKLYTDMEANADYYYNPTQKVFHTIDTARTAYNKAQYAKALGLGGVFVWTVDGDYNGRTVNALNDGLGNTLANTYSSLSHRVNNLYSKFGENIEDAYKTSDRFDMTVRAAESETQHTNGIVLGNTGSLIIGTKVVVGSDQDPNLTFDRETTLDTITISLQYTRTQLAAAGFKNIIIGYDNDGDGTLSKTSSSDFINAYNSLLNDDKIWLSDTQIKLDFITLCSEGKVNAPDFYCTDKGLKVYTSNPLVFTITKEDEN